MRRMKMVVFALLAVFIMVTVYWVYTTQDSALADFTGGPQPDNVDPYDDDIIAYATFFATGYVWYDGAIKAEITKVVAAVDDYEEADIGRVYEPSSPLSPVPAPDWGEVVGYFWYKCVVIGPNGYESSWVAGSRYPVNEANTITNTRSFDVTTGRAFFEDTGSYAATFTVVSEMPGEPVKELATKRITFYVW